jgi:hypothetical protein
MKIVRGTVVMLRPGFGSDAPIRAIAEEEPHSHKYSRAFSYRTPNQVEGNSWAYIEQVDSIISQPG